MGGEHNRLTVLGGYLGFLVMGVANAIIGPSLEEIQARFGLGLESLGLVFTVFFAGCMAAVTLGGAAADRVGGRRVMLASLPMLALGGLGAGLAPSWPLLLACFFCMGIGCGVIDTVNNLEFGRISARDRSAVLNRLHSFFGIGAMLGPVLTGAALKSGAGYPAAFFLVAAGTAVCWAMYPRARFGRPGAPAGAHHARLAAADRPFVWIAVSAFVYVGIETAVPGWAFKFLRDGKSAGIGIASASLSVYWGGLLLGRYAHGYGFRGWSNRGRMLVSLAASLAAYPVMALAPGPGLSLAMLGVIGFGFAPVFPALVAELADRTEGSSGKLTGALIAFGALGGSVIPPALGLIGAGAGDLGAGMWAGLGLVALLTGLVAALARI